MATDSLCHQFDIVLNSVVTELQLTDMPRCDWLPVAEKTTSNEALAASIAQAAAN